MSAGSGGPVRRIDPNPRPLEPMTVKDQTVFWPHGARMALSLVVNVEEGAEYNPLEGDAFAESVDEAKASLGKGQRNVANESNYQYGINEGGPRILRLLEKYGVRATFTAAAVALERAPELTHAIISGGHEVCAHGHRWIHQFRMDEAREAQFIKDAVASIKQTTGKRPVGWLSRYLYSPNTRRLLLENGFEYHMDDYSSDTPFWEPVGKDYMLVLPYAMDSNDFKLWGDPAISMQQWLQYAIDSFDWLHWEGKQLPRMMSLGLHQRIIGRPGRIRYLEEFLKHVKKFPDVWVAPRKDIADWWRRHHPPSHIMDRKY